MVAIVVVMRSLAFSHVLHVNKRAPFSLFVNKDTLTKQCRMQCMGLHRCLHPIYFCFCDVGWRSSLEFLRRNESSQWE